MTAIAPVPVVPGVTEEQVLAALAIAAEVYREAGVPVELVARVFRDPEWNVPPVVELLARTNRHLEFPVYRELIHLVPDALASAGLHEPEIPITTLLLVG